MGLVEMAQDQEVARWRWHEVDEACDVSRCRNGTDFLCFLQDKITANIIRTEYAFLWN